METRVRDLGVDQLSIDERIQLVEELWDSIAAEADKLEVPRSHQEELDRRLAAYQIDPRAGSTWEEVKTRLRKNPGTTP